MKKYLIPTFICAVLLGAASAYASEPDVSLDYAAGRITVSGATEKKDEIITVNILKPGVTAEALCSGRGEGILYNNDTLTDEEGTYSISAAFPADAQEGTYKVYVGGESFAAAYVTDVAYVSADSYSKAIEALNSAAVGSAEGFEAALKEYGEAIGLSNELSDSVDFAKTAALLQGELKSASFSETDSSLNKKRFDTAVIVQAFNEGLIQDFSRYADDVILKNENTMKYYNAVIKGKAGENVFVKQLSGKNIGSVSEFETAVEDALMIAVVRYPDGIGNIEAVLKEYSARTGAKTASASNSDYAYISGNTYTDITSLITAFNNHAGTTSASSSGGGGGGGGSSSSVITASKNASEIPVGGGPDTAQTQAVNAIGIKFEDLNSVDWAYTAISKLYALGVIEGRSYTIFAPNDYVTREEFAKLIVTAFGFDKDEYENTYTDVPAGAWYEEYVCAATKHGICNGIGDNAFGTGSCITRQDMAVMLYNAMKAKGRSFGSAELGFGDSADFADYSKIPVASLSDAGIVNGVSDTEFDPTGYATRAQAAVIINNALEH
ncbi:MAG: S-layer homology domain-containing protein [Candidatus Ornithomonoglobus sp.]